jgi:NAD-dependent deacetylase
VNIVILTGAGISAESGLGTFRDAGGLWARYRIEDVATPEAYRRDAARVHAFYAMRRQEAATAEPNAAHHALARLEADPHHAVTLVTQNVDSLHAAAGSRPLHMHGTLAGALCAACGHRWTAPLEMDETTPCPACARLSARPDVVWFGEIPRHLEEIDAALSAADLFVAIGTSGEVYPAAGFVDRASATGVETLEINLEPTSGRFDRRITGPASRSVPAWVATLIGPVT